MQRIITAFLYTALTVSATMAKSIELAPGELESMIDGISGTDITLTLKGKIDARDLILMRSIPEGVSELDLSGTSIEAYSDIKPIYYGRSLFDANSIPDYCFFATDYSLVKLPATTASIGKAVFAGSALSLINLPQGVSSIGDYAFYDCSRMTSVSLPAGLSSLGTGAFANCKNLEIIDLSNTNITEIPERCFSGCTSLKEIILPASVTKIGREAFQGTSVTSLSLPSVEILEPYALSGMYRLQELTLNPNASMGEGLLVDNATLHTLTGSPSTLPPLFAANCENLDPQQTIAMAEEIGDFAFANTICSELILSSGLTNVSRGAFHGTKGLEKIYATDLEDAIPATEEDAFSGLDCGNIQLIVKNEHVDSWKADPQWGLFDVRGETSTGTGATLADSGISIRTESRMLTVEASEELLNVKIFSIDGRMLQNHTPASSSFSISLEGITEQVVVVIAATGTDVKSTKIMVQAD